MMSDVALPGLSGLRRIELDALYHVCEILSRSLDFRHTSREVLRVLDEAAGMSRSVVTVLDPETGDLVVNAVSVEDDSEHAAIRYQSGEGLLGLILEDKGVLRSHMKVFTAAGEGETTSGSFSPTLERSIGLARLPLATQANEAVEIEIRGKRLKARTIKLPFVRNGKALV